MMMTAALLQRHLLPANSTPSRATSMKATALLVSRVLALTSTTLARPFSCFAFSQQQLVASFGLPLFARGRASVPRSSFLSSPPMYMSSASGPSSPLTHIGKDQMEDILESVEQEGPESGYVVMDVRGQDEIQMTGKLSPDVHTLPLPAIIQYKVFEMDHEDFEELCKFPKPGLDETLVFSCAAGIRSQHAAQLAAAQGGYTKLVNYMGGANEWFT